jgi:hypothetical protein
MKKGIKLQTVIGSGLKYEDIKSFEMKNEKRSNSSIYYQ